MPNSDLEKQVSTLQNELAEQKTANEALKDKVVAEQKAEYESQIEALSTQVTDSGSTLKEAEATISDLNQKLETLEETLASKEKDAEVDGSCITTATWPCPHRGAPNGVGWGSR